MKAFYPSSTGKIIHKGKSGNIYKLDGIQKCEALRNTLGTDNGYQVTDVSISNSADVKEATELINNTHSNNILEAYKSGLPAELANASGLMWQPSLYKFVLESALVSKYAVAEALAGNKSLAIVGGGHHAEREKPFGFCPINTMAISAKYASEISKSVTILDLDTHYSNGCFDTLKGNADINIYSLWNQKLDKWQYFKNDTQIQQFKIENAAEYFSKLTDILSGITKNPPDLFIYHLGLDVLETDRLGGIKGLNEASLYKRENLIKSCLGNSNIHLVIFLGGAYVDWSKGEEVALKQRQKLTELQHNLINILNN